jgi:Mor family transcriptional regulator
MTMRKAKNIREIAMDIGDYNNIDMDVLAKRYKTSKATIWNILNNKSWI